MKTDHMVASIPVVEHIQGLLHKIDRLRLSDMSHRDVESILVCQVSRELDRHLPWQAGHGRRTASVALRLGQASGLSSSELHQLKLAAYLHDIGLLMLPKGHFDLMEPDTHDAIKNHPRIGASLLEPFSFLKEASILIAHHHECWDGSGYPYGIRGPYVPFGSRILAIADAFDAIHVPYVSEQTLRTRIALRILRVSAGTQFDPQLVDLLHTAHASAWHCTVSP